jgi:hypothetical protein
MSGIGWKAVWRLSENRWQYLPFPKTIELRERPGLMEIGRLPEAKQGMADNAITQPRQRSGVKFPNDKNGDVLRRMAASGFDFSVAYHIEFFAMFCSKEDATLAARQLVEVDRADNLLASVTTDPLQGGATELKIVRNMLVTHAGIASVERQLGGICARYGGELDGWGVMQDLTRDGPSVPGTGETATRLDTPLGELDEAERNFVDGIRQHGWMQTHALDEDERPGFCFTTGFVATIGHPEILVFKIDERVANEIFWVLYRCARNGKPVPRAVRIGGILPEDDAYVFPVAKRHYANYLGWSRWFYRGDDFHCLQIVWPDEAGVFPWEEGFDSKYTNAQVDLTERGWAAEIAT